MDEVMGWALLLILAVVVIIFAAPYELAVLLYTFPLLVCWLLLPVEVGQEPQLVIDPSPHQKLAKLRAEKRSAEDQYDHIRFSDHGIRWSDNLDRFEERSLRGRDLNEQLEHWTAEADRIDREINRLSVPEWTVVDEWSRALRGWYQAQARNAAKEAGRKWALLVFVGAWVAGELFGIAFPSIIKFFAFAWNPAPEYLHPGIAIGTAAGWATGVCRALLPPRSFAKQAHARIKEYEAAKEAREQAEDNEMEGSRGDGGFEEKYDSFENDESHEENCEEQEPWYEVLGVSPEANEGEIKTAYRERIKQYHPDRVSGLGEKLQLLAKAETQRLNTAREEGLSLQR